MSLMCLSSYVMLLLVKAASCCGVNVAMLLLHVAHVSVIVCNVAVSKAATCCDVNIAMLLLLHVACVSIIVCCCHCM